jgi:hypothetical protein
MVHTRTRLQRCLFSVLCLPLHLLRAHRILAGYQALADECALRCRRLWLTLDPRHLSKASRAQLEARSKGWLQLRVASLGEGEGRANDEGEGHADAAVL